MKILGKNFEIITIDDNGLSSNMGSLNTLKNEINLSKLLKPDERAETTLHEVIHAIDGAFSIGLSETQVRQLSSGLFAVLAENGIKINFDNESQV